DSATPAKTPSKKVLAMSREYTPGDLVLHRLKGYPPWPAIVLSDEIAELKPALMKSKPGNSHKKGKAKAAEEGGNVRRAYPVAYLHNVLEQYVDQSNPLLIHSFR